MPEAGILVCLYPITTDHIHGRLALSSRTLSWGIIVDTLFLVLIYVTVYFVDVTRGLIPFVRCDAWIIHYVRF